MSLLVQPPLLSLLQEVERSEFSEEERQLSRRVITYWTNFIKTG